MTVKHWNTGASAVRFREQASKCTSKEREASMKAVDKYIEYLNEIFNEHWDNNKSVYDDDGNETTEWKKTDRMNNKIMWIVRDYFNNKNK